MCTFHALYSYLLRVSVQTYLHSNRREEEMAAIKHETTVEFLTYYRRVELIHLSPKLSKGMENIADSPCRQLKVFYHVKNARL